MPIFEPGSTKTVAVSVTVKPAGLECTSELYLSDDNGTTKAVSTGLTPFTSSGTPQQDEQPVVMPQAGVYGVFIEIAVAGVIVEIFQAPDYVTVEAAGEPRPLPKYGISSSYEILVADDASLAMELDLTKDIGAQYIRVDLYGGDGITQFDRVLAAAEARGLQVMAILELAPSVTPAAAQAFAQQQASRLAGRVWMFEFVNEPNTNGWTGAVYAQALIAAYHGLKAGNPDAVMIAGAMGNPGIVYGAAYLQWVRDIYANGGKGHFDYFSLHLYENPDTRDASWNAWDWAFYTNPSVRSIMDDNGDHAVPIISTETGLPSIGWSDEYYNETLQAIVVDNDFNHLGTGLSDQQGSVASFAIYTMMDDTMLLGHADGNGLSREPFARGVKPAWYTYQTRAGGGTEPEPSELATASSYHPEHDPSMAIDDDDEYSYWDSTPGQVPQWLMVDYGSVQSFGSIRTHFWDWDDRTYRYYIDISNDNVTWTRVVAEKAGQGVMVDSFISGKSARYVRVTVTYNSANAYAHIIDLAVGAAAPPPPPPPSGVPAFGISEALGDGRPWADIMHQLDEDVAIGAQYIRNMVDPDWGQWILDVVNAIEGRGMEVMAILTPSHPGGQGNDYSSPEDAAAYMARELEFIPNCRIFELENEVNQESSGWSTLGPAPYNTGSARDGGYNYGLACIAMYEVLKAAKPDSIFVAGALGGTQPYDEWTLNWLRGIYDSGCRLGHGFDAFSLHLYCDLDDWDNDWASPMWYKTYWHSSCVKSVMEEEYGDYNVPIISSESGEASSFRSVDEGPAGGHNGYFSEATQARIYGHLFDHLFGIAHPAGNDAGGPWLAYDGVSAPLASFCPFTMPDDSMYRQNTGYNNPDGFGLIRLDYSRKPSWEVCRARMAQGY